jgi:hypothetical protein
MSFDEKKIKNPICFFVEKQMFNCRREISFIVWIFLFSLFRLEGTMESGKFSVEIVTLGYIYPNAGASLAYQGPALDVAIEELRKTYGQSMDIKHTLLVDPKIANCPSLAENAEHMLSKWYYQSRTMANATAIISTSKKKPLEKLNQETKDGSDLNS